MPSSAPPPRPAFSELPLKKDGPRGNIWGLFGPDDELGLLNYITPEVTRQAASEEIRTGIRIPIDLPLNYQSPPMYLRKEVEHNIIQFPGVAGHDDEIKFNTQTGTQWDGFRHYGYQDVQLFYNGTTLEQVHGSSRIGIHQWVRNGGMATRGVLIDLPRWLTATSKPQKDVFAKSSITAQELEDAMKFQGVSTRSGDVLFIRTGYQRAAATELSQELKAERDRMHMPPSIGLDQGEDVLRFLWDSGAVAVASDCPALEALPLLEPGSFCLHEWLLAGWGCPIGELFDLERVAQECEEQGRYTFFFASMPIHVPGGVATPANGMVIF